MSSLRIRKIICYIITTVMVLSTVLTGTGAVFADSADAAAENTESAASDSSADTSVNLSAKVKGTTVTLTWNGSEGANYTVKYKISGSSTLTPWTGTVSQSADGKYNAEITDLQPKASYEFSLYSGDSLIGGPISVTLDSNGIENLHAVTGVHTIRLEWTAEAGKAYIIYSVGSDGSLTSLGEVTADTDSGKYTIGNLNSETTYRYRVELKNSDPAIFSECQATTEELPAPTLKISYNANNSIKLSWNKVSGATKYKIYRSGKRIKAVTGTSWLDETTSLKKGKKYTYYVAAADDGGIGAHSNSVSKKAKKTYTSAKVHTLYYTGHIIRTGAQAGGGKLFSDSARHHRIGTVPVGTKVTTYEPANGSLKIRYKRGGKTVTGWVNKERVKKTKSLYTTKDYSTAAKEKFVKNYSSGTHYLIWSSQYTQKVNIFYRSSSKANWKLVKCYTSSTGKIGRETPRSKYYKVKSFPRPAADASKHPGSIYYHHELGWFYSTHKVLYVVHFWGRNSFHTCPIKYINKATRDKGQRTKVGKGKIFSNTLGHPGSVGCTRLSVEGSKYLYYHCGKNTRVIQW